MRPGINSSSQLLSCAVLVIIIRLVGAPCKAEENPKPPVVGKWIVDKCFADDEPTTGVFYMRKGAIWIFFSSGKATIHDQKATWEYDPKTRVVNIKRQALLATTDEDWTVKKSGDILIMSFTTLNHKFTLHFKPDD